MEPLHLQVVCDRLWNRLKPPPGSIITAEQIGESGGVDVALEQYYDDEVARIAADAPTADERDIRDWFEHQLIIGEPPIRGQVYRGETATGGLDNGTADRLVDAKLVNRETRLKAPWYELSHDRLLPPVRRSNARWYAKHLNDVQRAAQRWAVTDRPDDRLMGVSDWLRAVVWARQPGVRIRDEERQYIRESGTALRRRLALTGLAAIAILIAAIAVWVILEGREDKDAARQQTSRNWANEAMDWLPTGSSDQDILDRGLLIAVAAFDNLDAASPSFEVAQSLLSGLVAQPYFAMPLDCQDGTEKGSTCAEDGAYDQEMAIAVSADGGRVATVDGRGRIILLTVPDLPGIDSPPDLDDPTVLAANENGASTSIMAFSPEGEDGSEYLAIAAANGGIELWNTGAPGSASVLSIPPISDADVGCGESAFDVSVPGAAAPPVTSLGYVNGSADSDGGEQGTFLVAGYANGAVIVRKPDLPIDGSGAPQVGVLCRDDAGASGVTTLAIHPAGDSFQIIAGYEDGTVWGWKTPAADSIGTQIGDLPGDVGVSALAIRADGNALAVGGNSGLCVLLGINDAVSHLNNCERSLVTTNRPVTDLVFAPYDPRTLFSSHQSGEMFRWQIPRDNRAQDYDATDVQRATGTSIDDLAFTPDGWLVSGASDGSVALWNPLGLPLIGFAANGFEPDRSGAVDRLCFAQDGNTLLLSAGPDGARHEQWFVDTIPATPTRAPAPSPAATPGFQGASSLLAGLADFFSGGTDSSPLAEGTSVAAATPDFTSIPSGGCSDAELLSSSDGVTISVVDGSAVIEMGNDTDATPFGLQQAVGLTSSAVTVAAMSEDGEMAATGHADGVIIIWVRDDDDWTALGQLPGHTGPITALAFRDDDHVLASGDEQGLVVLWDLRDDKDWRTDACTRAGRLLQVEEIEENLSLKRDDRRYAEQQTCADTFGDSETLEPDIAADG